VVSSWFGGTHGRSVTPSHIEAALGANTVDVLARSSGLTGMAVTSALTFVVPTLIGRFTASGGIASAPLPSHVSAFADRPVTGVDGVEEKRQPGWPGWLPWAVAATLGLIALLWLRAYAADNLARSRSRADAARSTVMAAEVLAVGSN
jgi:hypothetical protein